MHYVYLHGFCSGADSTKGGYFRERFAGLGGQLHTPDLNGDFSHMTVSSQLEILNDLAERLTGPLTLLGSSLGAYLAALYAQQHQRVERLVLLAPAFRFGNRYIDRLGEGALKEWRTSGFVRIHHHAYGEARNLHYGIVDDARRYDEVMLNRTLPALVMHGINDESVDYSLSIAYLKTNRQARLVLFHTDHGMIDVLPELWQHAREFLRLAAGSGGMP